MNRPSIASPSLSILTLFAAAFVACSSGGGSFVLSDDGGVGVPQPGSGEPESETPSSSSRDGGKRDARPSTPEGEDAGEEESDASASDGSASDAGKKDGSSGFDASTKDSGSTESCQFMSSCDKGSMEFCTTYSSGGSCVGARYKVDGVSFACASCASCTSAQQDAQEACTPTPAPTESCNTVVTSCKVGGNMQLCSVSGSSGCLSMSYHHNGKTYSCVSCSSCDAAYDDAYVACMDALYGCDDLQYCCGYFPSQSQTGCYNAVTSYRGQVGGDVSCKSTYESYRNAGYCP